MNKTVISIGTATQDVFLTGEVFKPKREKGVYYEHLKMGEKLTVESAVFTTGGNAGNAAVTFARQGLNSRFIGAVGKDPAGSMVKEDFVKEDVNISMLKRTEDYQTSYSVVLLAPNGERIILRSKGDTYKYLKKVDYSKLRADYAYISSMDDIKTLVKAIKQLSDNGIKIAFNPGSRELEKSKELLPILDKVHILIVNKDEAKKLFGKNKIASLIKTAVESVNYFVMTDGPNGVIATDGKKVLYGGIYEDVKVIDRLGAGDAFGSGFVAALARGKSLEKAVTFASANSTSVVQHIGAKEGILNKHSKIYSMPLERNELSLKS